MYSVTPMKSGWTLELVTDTNFPRILIKDEGGVIWEAIQFDKWDKRHAENVYTLLVALAGGPVGANDSLDAAS